MVNHFYTESSAVGKVIGMAHMLLTNTIPQTQFNITLNKRPNPIKHDPCTTHRTIYLLIVREGEGSKAAHFWKFISRKNQNPVLETIST